MDNYWKFITVAVAVFAAYVAYQQFRLGREKLKLDLFEKRFTIFKETTNFLSSIATTGKITPEQAFQFSASVAESIFLFESDIADYLDEIRRRALRLYAINEKVKFAPSENERNRLIDENTKEMSWVMEQLPTLKTKFSIYMRFHVWH